MPCLAVRFVLSEEPFCLICFRLLMPHRPLPSSGIAAHHSDLPWPYFTLASNMISSSFSVPLYDDIVRVIPSLQYELFSTLACGSDLEDLAGRMENLADDVRSRVSRNALFDTAAAAGSRGATNITALCSAVLELELMSKADMEQLSEDLDELFVDGQRNTSPGHPYIDNPDSVGSKKRLGGSLQQKPKRRYRLNLPHTSPFSSNAPSDTDPDSDSDSGFVLSRRLPDHHVYNTLKYEPENTSAPADHLRLWFLQNLSNPYPTPAQKEALATHSGAPRSKIDSDLTNWRRRAGWTEIKDRWASGDKAKMKRLVENVESGVEVRAEVSDEIERMRGYLERKEEQRVGDWVQDVGRAFLRKRVLLKQGNSLPRWPRGTRPLPPPARIWNMDSPPC